MSPRAAAARRHSALSSVATGTNKLSFDSTVVYNIDNSIHYKEGDKVSQAGDDERRLRLQLLQLQIDKAAIENETAQQHLECARMQRRLLEEKIDGRKEQSQFRYDVPLICNYGRFAQMVTLLVQTYVIYSEWDRIGMGVFLPLLAMFAIHGHNAFVRWRDSIDGRSDLKQLLSCSNNNLRVQYALAVLTAPVLALVNWWFLYTEDLNMLNSTLYLLATLVKVIASCGILIIEFADIFKEKAGFKASVFQKDILAALRAKGYELQPEQNMHSTTHAIFVDEEKGYIFANSDKRSKVHMHPDGY